MIERPIIGARSLGIELPDYIRWIRIDATFNRDWECWLFAYSLEEVRFCRLSDCVDCEHEFSHYCNAPSDVHGLYLLISGHYHWRNNEGIIE